jgi:hypothetical protein
MDGDKPTAVLGLNAYSTPSLSTLSLRPQAYDVSEFEKLAEKYETLSWRIVSKPGGATVKPDAFYMLYGCVHVCVHECVGVVVVVVVCGGDSMHYLA